MKKFLGNRKGAFAIQFALMVVPLTVCTGLAIDGGRAFLARFELESALDAAALAVGSTVSSDTNALNVLAKTYVDANFKAPHEGPITLTLNPTSDLVTLNGKVTLNTYFMPLVGQPTITVSAESQVRRGGSNVEVALALDITESMSTSKMTALKAAAKDLIATVVNDVQTPYFSKVAVVPWGNNVHPSTLTGTTWTSYADSVRGAAKGQATVTAATWKNGSSKTVSTATWRTGSEFTISKIAKVSSKVQVTVSANPSNFANGDIISLYVTSPSTNSFNYLTAGHYMVADKTTSSPYTFNLKDTNGTYLTPPGGTITNATAGKTQECLNSKCEVAITTSSSISLSAGDGIYISGVGSPYSGVNNSAGQNWVVAGTPAPTSTVFYLSGSDGPDISGNNSANGAAGTAQKCFNNTCAIQLTAAGHGLTANGQYMQLTTMPSSGSWNTFNNATPSASTAATSTAWWPIEQLSGDNFVLTGTTGTSATANYSGTAGRVQCLQLGCAKYRFQAKDNNYYVRAPSECVTERYGADAETDAAPSTSSLGWDYPGTGDSLVACETANYITLLTPDKTKLNKAIDDLKVSGSTTGQQGVAWGWYLVSPNFSYLWPADINKPKAYGAKELSKVLVLMTDGEFNTAHCNGVQSSTYGYSSIANSNRIKSCDPAKTPFEQAQALCSAAKAQKVIIYTVGFQVGSAPGAADFLTACATDTNHAYLADDAAALKAAFKSIATNISKLRISK